jgi:lipid-A-disaccharide synthase-like uncharacterized protein
MTLPVAATLSGSRTQAAVWRGLGVMSALLMDVCWVIAWLRLIAGNQSPPPALVLVAWFLAVGMTAYALSRLSSRLFLKSAVHQVLGGIGLVMAFLLSLDVLESSLHGPDLAGAVVRLAHALSILLPVPDEVVIFLAVVLLWQRGSVLAGSPDLRWGREGLHFRVGVLLYAIYIGVRADIEGGVIPELLPLFFLTSMLAMAIARANSLAHQPGGSRAPLNPRWMAGLAGVVASATALGVAAGYALNSYAFHRLVILIGVGIGAVLGLLFSLMLPLLMVFNPLLQVLIDWLRQLFEGLGAVMAQVQVNPVVMTPTPSEQAAEVPGWLQALTAAWPIIQWALILAAGLAVIVLVTRSRRRRRGDVFADLESDEDVGRAKGHLDRPGVLTDVQRRLGDWMRSVVSRPWLATVVIRRIYQAMLDKAANDGRPRRSDETPAEFQGALVELYPAAAQSVGEITAAYELVRYGFRPEAPEAVERVQRAWSEFKRVSI